MDLVKYQNTQILIIFFCFAFENWKFNWIYTIFQYFPNWKSFEFQIAFRIKFFQNVVISEFLVAYFQMRNWNNSTITLDSSLWFFILPSSVYFINYLLVILRRSKKYNQGDFFHLLFFLSEISVSTATLLTQERYMSFLQIYK